MAAYFVASTGSNTAPYDTWAKAATSLQTALTAATANNDIVALDVANVPTADKEISATTTWTVGGNILLVASTNTGTSTITPTVMGATYWIGNSTLLRTMTLTGAFRVRVYGITFRQADGGSININKADGGHFELEGCRLWASGTASSSTLTIGSYVNNYTKTINCTVKVDKTTSTTTQLSCWGEVEHVGLVADYASALTNGFLGGDAGQAVSGSTRCIGCDLSLLGSGVTLVANNTRDTRTTDFIQCKLPANYVAMATQTVANKSSSHVNIYDSDSGDVHVLFGYYDALGSVVSDTSTYFTAGAAAQSWKITTTASCSFLTPFVTPWVAPYNSTVTSISPYLEVLRNNGSATSYTDAEVWGEFMVKTAGGSPLSSLSTDSQSLANYVAGTAGTNQAAGAGTGSWTIAASNSPYSNKIGVTVTPAEVGHIMARLLVAVPSIAGTVYVDPQLRT